MRTVPTIERARERVSEWSERASGASGAKRSAAERVSERTSAAERTSERKSGPFFTAPFQTDLSHRVMVG